MDDELNLEFHLPVHNLTIIKKKSQTSTIEMGKKRKKFGNLLMWVC
jgi:hypothetical protein